MNVEVNDMGRLCWPISLITTCVCCCLCWGTNAAYAQSKMDKEEYLVYSAMLSETKESPNDGKPVRLYVIGDQTEGAPAESCPADAVVKSAKGKIPSDISSILEDYKAKNKASARLSRTLNLKVNYVLVSEKEFDSYFAGDDVFKGWRAFYEKYPDSPGFITFSRVGFNAAKTKALVYEETYCGGTCGLGWYVILSKDKGAWKFVGGLPCRVS